ncbi:hypothetical protein SODALDRAFT_374342 [Sodiomyces alkalinus F11]|uniref:Uncharacterized protein n=1 Tax=Sodiomyces alkalinus (strain CBS 110278 / VKM F-3762 / F11) TaxID=1314773 RepID=A0A3N2Q5A7_SODAK|nr:hypothetical protein SODALDRAFT_374342 [Sodiomyces alkalinus F11]ROT41951.1 hypothetical protein SODALDRAFT_374342 [Sodiomyces alkalinus F11]
MTGLPWYHLKIKNLGIKRRRWRQAMDKVKMTNTAANERKDKGKEPLKDYPQSNQWDRQMGKSKVFIGGNNRPYDDGD